MILRAELEPQITIAEKLFPKIFELISLYDSGYDNEDEAKMKLAINQISSLTNKNINVEDLFEYWEGESQGELTFKLSLPYPFKVENISKEELIEIVQRMQSFDDNGISEKLSDLGVPLSGVLNYHYYPELIKRNFAYPDPSSLLDKQFVNGKYVEYSTEEIVNRIMSYKAIAL
jgi:hypothetical protein